MVFARFSCSALESHSESLHALQNRYRVCYDSDRLLSKPLADKNYEFRARRNDINTSSKFFSFFSTQFLKYRGSIKNGKYLEHDFCLKQTNHQDFHVSVAVPALEKRQIHVFQ